MAGGDFRFARTPPRPPGWKGWLSRFGWQERFYQLRRGEGIVSAGDLVAVVLTVEPDAPLQVRMSRLIAFEGGLEFRHRFLRRIAMSPAGAWHSVILSGQGRAVVGCVGRPLVIDLEEEQSRETDFEPEMVVAWQPAQAPVRFALHRLTLAAFLLPAGAKQVRMSLGGACRVWLDGGPPQAWVPAPRPGRPAASPGWPPPR